MVREQMTREQIKEIEEVFMQLEGDYVLELINKEPFKKYFEESFDLSNDELYILFKEAYEGIENGEYNEEEAEQAEIVMIASVLALSEKIKKLKLVKTLNNRDEQEGYGRRR